MSKQRVHITGVTGRRWILGSLKIFTCLVVTAVSPADLCLHVPDCLVLLAAPHTLHVYLLVVAPSPRTHVSGPDPGVLQTLPLVSPGPGLDTPPTTKLTTLQNSNLVSCYGSCLSSVSAKTKASHSFLTHLCRMRTVVMAAQRMAPSQLQPRHISSPVAISSRCLCDPVQVLGRPCLRKQRSCREVIMIYLCHDQPVSCVLSQPLPRQLVVIKMESKERQC